MNLGGRTRNKLRGRKQRQGPGRAETHQRASRKTRITLHNDDDGRPSFFYNDPAPSSTILMERRATSQIQGRPGGTATNWSEPQAMPKTLSERSVFTDRRRQRRLKTDLCEPTRR